MMTLIRTAAAIVLCFLAVAATAETSTPPAGQQDQSGKLDSFSLVPPKKWKVNIDDANDRGMYAYMVMDEYTFETSPAIIYVRLMDKTDLGVDEHLKADMDDYRKKKIDVSFHPFKVGNLNYTYAARKYTFGKKSCDYVCYIDPGKNDQSYLIFVLTTDYEHCNSYTQEFRSVLKSFQWTAKPEQ